MALKQLSVLVGGAIVSLGLTLPAAASAAPQSGNTISSVSAVCQPDGMFRVTVGFSHRSPVEVRVYDVIGGSYVDSDHAWYYQKGSGTFQGILYGGGGKKVTIETHLLTAGPRHALVDVVTPVSTAVGTCVAVP
jgi:hypothetical protein